jgi:hypothetical protein
MADEPKKPLDRRRPFKRINNEQFRPKDAPDGEGVPCGCHTPKDFGEGDEEFVKFIFEELPAVKVIDDVLKTVSDVANLLNQLKFTVVLIPIAVIAGAVKDVADIVRAVLRTFFHTVARRILPRAVRVTPQWMPVKRGAPNTAITPDQIVEVEGICTRSYQNPVDVPFFNWNFWFHWSIHVKPEPDYSKVLSPAPNPPSSKDIKDGATPVKLDGTFEIQWDSGGLFADRSAYDRGFPDSEMPLHDGPMFSLDMWPMASMFVWASGRWVYDCSQSSDADKPLMPAMMNPPRALATARFGAVDFAENNNRAVPAIQFLFFSCRRGGYLSHGTLADTDYEFILDLPPVEQPKATFPIGHTPSFPANTIVVRPRLLKKLDAIPFAGAKLVEPQIEVVRPDDPTKAPSQVKLKIAKDSLSGTDAAAFLLSLGWHDPAEVQARTVKRCRIEIIDLKRGFARDAPAEKIRAMLVEQEAQFKAEIKRQIRLITVTILPGVSVPVVDIPIIGPMIEKFAIDAVDKFINLVVGLVPAGSEEWMFRFGVNGRWRSHFFKEVTKDSLEMRDPQFDSKRDDFIFDLALGPDDELFIATNGAEFDPVGDMMRAKRDDRFIKLRGNPVPWSQLAALNEKDRRAVILQYVLKSMIDTTGSLLALGLDNEPLGFVDPDPSQAGTTKDNNPILVKNVTLDTATVVRQPIAAKAVGDQMILVNTPNRRDGLGRLVRDYRLTYKLEIKDNIPRS